jgi:hypothetical protein
MFQTAVVHIDITACTYTRHKSENDAQIINEVKNSC